MKSLLLIAFSFQLLFTTNIFAYSYQENAVCGVMATALTSYESITTQQNDVYNTCTISVRDFDLTEDAQQPVSCYEDTETLCSCDPSDENTTCSSNNTCTIIPEPENTLTYTVYETTETGYTTVYDDITLTDEEYGNYIFPNHGTTINFQPEATYSDADVKLMLLGNFLFQNNDQSLIFDGGDYYFKSFKIDSDDNGNINQINICAKDDIRIFVRDEFVYSGNHINDSDCDGSIFIYVEGDSTIDANGGGSADTPPIFIYTKGDTTIENSGNSNDWNGAITSEGTIDISGQNINFIYDKDAADYGYGLCPIPATTADLCYNTPIQEGFSIGPFSYKYGVTTPVDNISNQEISDVTIIKSFDGISMDIMSAIAIDGVDKTLIKDDDEAEKNTDLQASYGNFNISGLFDQGLVYRISDFGSGSDTNSTHTIYDYSTFSFDLSKVSYDVFYTKDGILYSSELQACPTSYCDKNDLEEGFHVIDPDGGDEDNSFEIFCHKDAQNVWHDLIALPIKNSSNNFLFDDSSTTLNYYNEDDNPRTHFHAIEIDGLHISYDGTKPKIPVKTLHSEEPWQITTNGHTYNVMGAKFSNINLIGTPFTIEWDDAEIVDCNTSQLRKALNQAVKYNTLTEDDHSRCKILSMNLSLLDDYRFLVYHDEEVLQHSCKEMAIYIPDNTGVLQDSEIDGHFNILTSEPSYPNSVPTTNGTREASTDLGDASSRPLTVYCKYQTDLNYVWTFLTALDGVVTNSKNDIINGSDTCSQLGLWFFVPNTKETFNRVRLYLKNQKDGVNGWENYTGTVREKYKMYRDNPDQEYYLPNLGYEKIWPYGPLGIYYPCNGNRDSNANCAYRAWYPGQTNVPGWMSGSPMHNISSMGNYIDSMGKKGWVSILGSQDLNKTDNWWIADIGAGEEIGNSEPEYSPHGSHLIQSEGYKYYEPNGNYSQNAWLNFLHDDEGWIYHNDDNNAFYAYYDYMCMSETNYDSASRYSLIPGFFNAIEHATRDGNTAPNFWDDNITTKIVNEDISLDLLLYAIDSSTGEIDRTSLNQDNNKSVGVFLSSVDETSATPIKYLGTYENFDGYNGRIPITTFDLSSASKRNVIQFYFCDTADLNWTECWDFSVNNNNGSITLSPIEDAASSYSDSADDFSIRPKNFTITTTTGLLVRATDVNFSYLANDYDNNPTLNYNEFFTNLNLVTTLADPTMVPNCPDPSLSLDTPDQFNDGSASHLTSLTNVGVYNIKIQEINGMEFALVDADDTPDSDRFIQPADLNITILPDHFHLTTLSNINYAPTFTYISNDLDHMALKFDLNVSAQNSHNTVTTNYTSGCFSNNNNIDLQYNNAPASLTMLAKELNNNITGTVTSPNINFTIPSTVYTHDHNGSAELALRLNFARATNQEINPFKVNFNDINISDQTTTLHIGTDSSHIIDLNGSMIYGRTHGPRQRFVGNTGNALIYYEAYCYGTDSQGTTCNKNFLPNGPTSQYTDDPRWFINTNHNTITYGAIGSVNQKSANNITLNGVITINNGNAQAPLIYGTAANPAPRGYPYKATMENNASSWLIYDQFDAAATKNEFDVEFTDSGNDWAGKRETNTSTSKNATDRTNRRTMW